MSDLEKSISSSSKKIIDEISYLIENYHSKTRQELSCDLNKSPRWIKRQIAHLKSIGKITPKRPFVRKPLSESDWTTEIKQYAIDLRINKLKSSKEISLILKDKFGFDYPEYTIEHWLINKFNCSMPTKQEWLSKYLLYNNAKEFLSKGWRVKDISDYLKKSYEVYISDDLLLSYLNDIGLSGLKVYRINSIRDKSKEYTKEWLEECINNNLSIKDISDITGFSKTIVMKRIREENINLIKHRIPWSYDLDNIRSILLNIVNIETNIPKEDQHQMILGWLLGDGSLNNTGRFIVHHTLSQLSYIYVKIKVLNKYVSSIFTVPAKLVSNDKIFSEGEDQMGFSCIGMNYYTKYLNPDGSKNYRMIIEELNDIGWACYYMDDGSRSGNRYVISMNEDSITYFENKYKFGKKLNKNNIIVNDIRNEYILPHFGYKVNNKCCIGDYWKIYIKDIFCIESIKNIVDLSLVNSYITKQNSNILNLAVDYYQKVYGFPHYKVYDSYLYKNWNSLKSFNTKYLWKEDNILKQIHVGDSIFKNFMGHISEAKSKGISPKDIFNNFSLFRDILEKTLEKNKSILPKFVYNNLFFNARGVSGFPCGIAKALINRFCSQRGLVVDPCSGWGGRLLGAISSERRYFGFEPWDKTVDGLNKIISFIETEDAIIINSDFCIENAPNICDMILTSPPYMDFEFYGKAITKESWDILMKDIFLYAEKSLIVGGYLLINLPKYLKELLPKTSLVEHPVLYWFSSSRKRDVSKAETIFVWRK